MKETVLGSKLFIDCSLWKMGAYHLLRVDQSLNTFCGKECPGRDAYWLNPQGSSGYLISMENSVLIYMTTGHISYVESVTHIPGQETGRKQGSAYHLRWVPGFQRL
jgi:hypothetical protein